MVKVIRVSVKADKVIRSFAAKRGISIPEAASQLVVTGQSRLAALAKYAKKPAKKAPKRKPKSVIEARARA
jgi:hypothetical protein